MKPLIARPRFPTGLQAGPVWQPLHGSFPLSLRLCLVGPRGQFYLCSLQRTPASPGHHSTRFGGDSAYPPGRTSAARYWRVLRIFRFDRWPSAATTQPNLPELLPRVVRGRFDRPGVTLPHKTERRRAPSPVDFSGHATLSPHRDGLLYRDLPPPILAQGALPRGLHVPPPPWFPSAPPS